MVLVVAVDKKALTPTTAVATKMKVMMATMERQDDDDGELMVEIERKRVVLVFFRLSLSC